MQIDIAERLRPYSHRPGIFFLLPGSPWRVQVFPCRLLIDDLSGPTPNPLATLDLCVQGPLNDFTVLQDLEKGELCIWGKSSGGFLRYHLQALTESRGVRCYLEKTPLQGMTWLCTGKWQAHGKAVLQSKYTLILGPLASKDLVKYEVPSIDRLSLGSHKSQDWELIRRREEFTDIFPLWHRLGQLISPVSGHKYQGMTALLEECRQAIDEGGPEFILSHFRRLFLAGFDGALSPRLSDTDYQGILATDNSSPLMDASPLTLLIEGSTLIRSLFVKEKAESIAFLPSLPPEFACGRLKSCGASGLLNFEWTKKSLRRVTFLALQSKSMAFVFSQGEKRCRLRHSYKDRGLNYESGAPLELVAGENYWFDNFTR